MNHYLGGFALTQCDTRISHLNNDEAAAYLGYTKSGVRNYPHSGKAAGYGRAAFNGIDNSLIAFMQ